MGRLTKDPEIRYTQGGAAIASFDIALDEKYKAQSGEMIEKVHFFKCSAFGKTAENINKFFSKGARILLQGSLQYESWKAQDGTIRSTVAIKVHGFDFIEVKAQAATQGSNYDDPQRHNVAGGMNKPAQHQQQAIPEIDINSDEIPF